MYTKNFLFFLGTELGCIFYLPCIKNTHLNKFKSVEYKQK